MEEATKSQRHTCMGRSPGRMTHSALPRRAAALQRPSPAGRGGGGGGGGGMGASESTSTASVAGMGGQLQGSMPERKEASPGVPGEVAAGRAAAGEAAPAGGGGGEVASMK